MKYSEINMNTTLDINVLAEALNAKAEQTIEAGPEILSHRGSYIGDSCAYLGIQNMYASAIAISIHEFLRSDVYTDSQKREVLKPFVGVFYGTADEEMELVLRVSAQVDLIDDLLLRDINRTSLMLSNRDMYFDILQEWGNLMIDTMIGSTDCDKALKKVQADADDIRNQRDVEREANMAKLLSKQCVDRSGDNMK